MDAGNCQKRQRQSGVRKTFERFKLKMKFFISPYMLELVNKIQISLNCCGGVAGLMSL